ncbi:hypothetical protein [Kitasatospora sp. NPDC001683]
MAFASPGLKAIATTSALWRLGHDINSLTQDSRRDHGIRRSLDVLAVGGGGPDGSRRSNGPSPAADVGDGRG